MTLLSKFRRWSALSLVALVVMTSFAVMAPGANVDGDADAIGMVYLGGGKEDAAAEMEQPFDDVGPLAPATARNIDWPLPLEEGMNFISLPLAQDDTTLSVVLSSIAGEYDSLEFCNASTGAWETWSKLKNDTGNGELNSLTELDHARGFWINVTTPGGTTLMVNGTERASTDIQLYEGWNMAGYPTLSVQGLGLALGSIAGLYDCVEAYDAADVGDPWKSDADGDLTLMQPGRAYWIHMTTDAVWTIGDFVAPSAVTLYASTPTSGGGGGEMADHVVISEFNTRGPSGAYDEFVEIYNPTNAEVDIGGWTIEYLAATGSGGFRLKATFPSPTYLPSHGYALAANSYGTWSGPDPDVWWTDTQGFSDNGGHIFLNNSGTYVDKVGYGTAIEPEGDPGPVRGDSLDDNKSAERKASATSDDASMSVGGAEEFAGNGRDSENNSEDFFIRTMRDPQNLSSSLEPFGAPPGCVELNWTAPGDDGNTGTASQYVVRMSASPILTEGDWLAASDVAGEPVPGIAGTPESFIVSGLMPGQDYYFAMKTADEVPNWSPLSNSPNATASYDGDAPLTSNVLADGVNPLTIVEGTASIVLTAKVDDSATGGSNISAAEYWLGADPGEGAGTPMNAQDGTYDNATENVTITIDTSSWNQGVYVIYVRGQDELGSWGPNMSVVVTVLTNSPQVVEPTSPANGETGVDNDTAIVISFTKAMDNSTFAAHWSIAPAMAGSFEWSAGNTTVTFTPSVNWSLLTTYNVTIDGAAEDFEDITLDGDLDGDSEGTPADDYTFNFTIRPEIPPIILVDDDLGLAYEVQYQNALAANGYAFDTWNVSAQGSPDLATLSLYPIVVWHTSEDYQTTLTTADQTTLASYLDGGGRLFLEGEDIGFDIGTSTFYHDYLHATFLVGDTTITTVNGMAGDPIGDGLTGLSLLDGYQSEIEPRDGYASAVFNYSGGSQIAGIKAEAPGYKVVYFAFCYFEGADGQKNTVMDRVITWLQAPFDTEAPTFAGIESIANPELGGTLDLSWSAATDNSTPITYNIYEATSSGGQSFATPNYTTQSTTYQVTGLTDYLAYYYVVRAEDTLGNEDSNVVELSGTPTPDVTDPVFGGLVYCNDTVRQGTLDLWWEPATDQSAPITYNIYQATTSGGQNFGAANYTTQSTSYRVSGLTNFTTYYFVVRAEDPYGNEESNVVEKNATPTGTVVQGDVLLVDDDLGLEYQVEYQNALTANGYTYDTWNVSAQGSPDIADLSTYPIVVWHTSEDYQTTLTAADQATLSSYLDGGGRLFLEGEDIGHDIGTTPFYRDYLHANFLVGDTTITTVNGIAGDPIGDGLTGLSLLDSYQSEIAPRDVYGTPVFEYAGGNQVAGIKVEAPGYKVVYFAFCYFEGTDGQKNTVMDRVITWLQAPFDTEAPTFAGIESITNPETGGTLDLSWSTATDNSTPITYNIYEALSPGGQSFATPNYTTQSTGYQVTGLTDFVTYYYVVRAEDTLGNEDSNVVELSGTPTPDTNDPVFGGLVYCNDSALQGTLDLWWEPATDQSAPITYNIYQATTSGGQDFGAANYTTQSTSYQVDGLTNFTTYYFVVRAEDPHGNEESNTVEKNGTPTGAIVQPQILLVDDDNGATEEGNFSAALTGAGYTFDQWQVSSQGSPDLATLQAYQVVVWFTSADYETTLTSTDQTNLGGFLDGGGRLFLTGQDIGYDIGASSFYSGYLHADYLADSTGIGTVDGVADDPVTDGLSGLAIVNDYPSSITTYDEYANPIFTYGGTGMTGGVKAETSTYKVVYFAFNYFEGADGQKNTVMDRVITWLRQPHDATPPTFGGITSVTSGITQTLDLFWGAATDPSGPITYNIYEAASSGGQNFAAPSYTTSDLTYRVTGLTNGQTYYYVVRAQDTALNEDGNAVELSGVPNPESVPPVFAGLVYVNDTTYEGTLELWWEPATDPSAPITYNIYMATSSGSQDFGAPNYTTQDTGIIINGLTNFTTYYFVVRAEDANGNEETNTVEVSGTPTGETSRKKYAVIVGVSDYKVAAPDLDYCDEDATDWYNYLTNPANFEDGIAFEYVWVYGDSHPSDYPQYDGLATEYNVKQALQNMVSLAGPNDFIAFTFSGHGNGDFAGAANLCMWDSGSGESGENGDLWDTELANILDSCVAERQFIFLDSCLSGGFGPELMAMPNSDAVYCTTTCQEDGYGYDEPAYLNGAWTYWYLEAGLIGQYSTPPPTSCTMEQCYTWADSQYNPGGNDEPMEFDGDPGTPFTLG